MEIVNCQNPNEVKYFDLFDYISNIRINTAVLEHMQETNVYFDKYMSKLKSYNYNAVTHMWLINTADELANSQKIEHHYIPPEKYLKMKKSLAFDTLEISHERIHNIHNFVMPKEDRVNTYRNGRAWVSYFDKNGIEHIYWYAAEPEDVVRFMDDFIDVYNSKELSVINSNPFLKSALITLLFIRIHPYRDGNGRTSRVLYNMKFTELVNRAYDMDLNLCPLNISANILINQLTYVNILDNIYFDLEHDNNEYINRWFNFILNMADEQLNYLATKVEDLEATYELYKEDEETFDRILRTILDDDRILRRIFDDIKKIDQDDLHNHDQKKIGPLIDD